MLVPGSDDAEVVEQPGTELPRVPEVTHRRCCIRIGTSRVPPVGLGPEADATAEANGDLQR